ncbi:hypothetical protein D3C80_1176710 [compost metagenome]
MQAAGLLELQRRLAGDAEADAASDDIKAACLGQGGQGGGPVLSPGGVQQGGQAAQGGGQVGVAAPFRCQVGDGAEAGDKALGCGDRQFRPGTQGNGQVRDLAERRILDIDQGDDEGAARACPSGGGDQIGTLAGLRHRQAQAVRHMRRAAIDRTDGQGHGAGQHPDLGLDQIAGEDAGVVGTASAADQGGGRRIHAQPLGGLGHDPGVGGQLGGDEAARGGGFGEHQRVFGAHQAGPSFSSATKS